MKGTMPAARFAAMAAAIMSSSADAQRVDENAVEQAQDAFGLSVGQESIGLYTSQDARGFSPQDAGNVVIEGMYFDQQSFSPTSRVIERTTLGVGLAAQSYPFAAPTGIVEYRLRLPGSEQITSIAAGIGPHDRAHSELDVQIPLTDTLSVGLGVGYEHQPHRFDARESQEPSAGAILRWRPNEASQAVAFAGWSRRAEERERPLVFLRASVLPPRFEQDELLGQDWSYWKQDSFDYGILTRTDFGSRWVLRTGTFGSMGLPKQVRNEFLFVTEPDGTADYYIAGVPAQRFESVSGEVRLSRVMGDESGSRHAVHFIGRGRDSSRRYGGDDERFIGNVRIGERIVIDEPDFIAGPIQRMHNRQLGVGIAYSGTWDRFGAPEEGGERSGAFWRSTDVNLGVQRSRFERGTQDRPDAQRVEASDATWLYNAALAAHFNRGWTLFGSYSRGLEESGSAPESAINRRQSTPLVLSEQIDLGLRYRLTDELSLVVAGFEIGKPYYGLSSQQLFTQLGRVRHRGIEASLTGELLDDLDVVVGLVHIDPELSGASVASGETGRVPVGPVPDTASIGVSYSPPAWSGFALESSLRYNSSRIVSRDNALTIDASTELDAGFRHRFEAGRWRLSLRFQALNLTDSRGWEVQPSGQVRLSDTRRYTLSLTADR